MSWNSSYPFHTLPSRVNVLVTRQGKKDFSPAFSLWPLNFWNELLVAQQFLTSSRRATIYMNVFSDMASFATQKSHPWVAQETDCSTRPALCCFSSPGTVQPSSNDRVCAQWGVLDLCSRWKRWSTLWDSAQHIKSNAFWRCQIYSSFRERAISLELPGTIQIT